MNNVYDTDLLIQLLDGELPPAEREQLLTRLRNDPQLQSEWAAISQSKELLQRYGQKKQIGTIHQEMMKELAAAAESGISAMQDKTIQNMFPGRTVKINLLRAVAAVLLLLLSAALFPYFTTSPEKLFSSQFAEYKAGGLRGTAGSVIESDYRSGNREKTVADYKGGLSTGPQDDFLAGTVYLQLHQPVNAANNFQAAIKANREAGTHFLEPETKYYLALAWLAADEPKKALPLFSDIRADRNNPYHDSISWWFMQKLRRLAARQDQHP